MKLDLKKIFRSAKSRNLVLLVVMLGTGGGAYGFKKSYDPGPLSGPHPGGTELNGYQSHADFEKECKHCHAPVRCLSPNLCQECHQDIARQRAEAGGLHGLLPGTDKCQTCHMEHQGREAVISAVPFANINHERLTGFSLAQHQLDYDGTNLTCERCHTEGTFAPESVDCTTCHDGRDSNYMGAHTDRFGGNCLGCHDGRDRMIGLDHASVFVLDGAHEGLECEDCHAGQVFASVSRPCADCHEEPEVHAGAFGLDCARCHGSAAWAPAELRQHLFFLDHGSEERLECQTCHVETYTAVSCYGCHDHDPAEMHRLHLEEGITEDQIEDCALCHPTGQPGEAGELARQTIPGPMEQEPQAWGGGGDGGN
ncbi:MAG TPA: hypothetical protein VLC52_16870 [Anaerolineae bacterium]|nr:hypothetical protein [Anaerolineae bacterium]